ncbi:hypothetical protein KP509_19G013000 [Ceratopteris richardii]|uniref:RING-type E3 ubiquitin transferase n=1 Tax=Ceratopteris richardii TaxID=49495 RepID=A0A8T2SHW2_CERRI|nr:hypothetical protein KP509_19G013000 [Ceratopteris richardii]
MDAAAFAHGPTQSFKPPTEAAPPPPTPHFRIHSETLTSGAPSSAAGATTSLTDDGDGSFDCHICLDVAQEPVVTVCGHLFCWPCIYEWLHVHSPAKDCPVCKACVGDDGKIVPLYGKGKLGAPDPRMKRPMAQRPHGHVSSPPLFPPGLHTTQTIAPSPPEIAESHLQTRRLLARFPHPSAVYPQDRASIFALQFENNDFFNTSSSSSSSFGSPSREGFTSRFRSSNGHDQREVIFYRLYIVLVCVVVALLLFF